MKIITTLLAVLILSIPSFNNAQADTSAAITSVPVLMSAPVVLYDEANNVLADGNYVVTIGLFDSAGAALFSEEQNVPVRNGVAHIAVGQGFAVGSNFTSPSAGLDWTLFNHQGDITVEILVEGQANPQEVAVLGTQPYSFVSQYSLSVADNAISSAQIADGSIQESDLSVDLLAFLSFLSATSESTASTSISIDAANVNIPSSMSLSNAPGSNLATVLQGLDAAIGTIRDIDLQQSLTNISTTLTALDNTYATDAELSSAITTINTTKLSKSGDTMTGDLNMGGNNIVNVNLVDGVDVGALKQDVNGILTPTGSVSDAAIPQALRPFAYGTIASTSASSPTRSCSGYNIQSDCDFSSSPTNNNYTVILTPTRSFGLGGSCTGYYGGSCRTTNKTTATFTVACTCDFTSQPNEQNVEFVVYYNPE